MKMKSLDWIAWAFAVIGTLNWGLVGVTNLNLVTSVLGAGPLTQLVYILIGLSGLYMLWSALSKRK